MTGPRIRRAKPAAKTVPRHEEQPGEEGEDACCVCGWEMDEAKGDRPEACPDHPDRRKHDCCNADGSDNDARFA